MRNPIALLNRELDLGIDFNRAIQTYADAADDALVTFAFDVDEHFQSGGHTTAGQ